MTNLITTKSIENTKSFKTLLGFQKNLLIKRDNRAVLENALIHYNATGVILPQIGASNIKILTEIIKSNGDKNTTAD